MRPLRYLATFCALFIGSIASASSVQNIDLQLSLGERNFLGVFVTPLATGETLPVIDRMPETDDPWGLPLLFPTLSLGDTLRFTASIDDGGVLTSCTLAGLDCTGASSVTNTADSILFKYGSFAELAGGLGAGASMIFETLQFGTFITDAGDTINWFSQNAKFTVLGDEPQPAPVPLPASGLMLVAACAGMGALRRRRRAA